MVGKKSGKIAGWKKSGDWWTYTGSPGFVQRPGSRGYLAIRRAGLSGWRGVKKNGVWMLRNSAPQLLRQQETPYPGSVLWGCADLPGGGGAGR